MAEEKTFSVGVQTSSPTRINVTSNVSENPITASADTGLYYSQLAKNWAIGEGLIQNEDYSSKTWAGESKASADLSKMYSEAASLDLENLENKISIYDEQLNTTLAEGLDSISSAVTSGVGEIDTSKLNVLAQIEEVVNASIEDINATGIDTKVSKSGDTMTGSLTVGTNGDEAPLVLKNSNLDVNVAPTNPQHIACQFKDKNDVTLAAVQVGLQTDRAHSVAIVSKKSANEDIYASLNVGFYKDGTAYATAPTYTTYTDSSTKIATTEFLKNVLKGNGYGLASFSKSTHGHLTFDNGIIFQWGLKSTTSNKFALTYPKPFPSRTASIVITASNDNTDGTSEFKVSDVTQTGCNIRSSASTIGFYWFAIGY